MKYKRILVFMFMLVLASGFVSSLESSDIRVTLLNQDPDPVEQGEVVEVRFKIENLGAQTVDNVDVEILPDYPFSLYTGNSVESIGRLRAGQTGVDAPIVDFKLRVDEEAQKEENEIELKINVGDISFLYNQNEFMIDVESRDVPEIKVYIRESNILQAGERGTVTIEMANTEQGDAKFVQFTLMPTDEYQLLSTSNYVYIGDIDSDDTESEDFEIYANPSVKEFLTLPVSIQYQDEDDEKYEERVDLKLRIYSASEISRIGLKEKNYTVVIVVVIVAIIIGYLYWRKRRKRKE